tara:strand:+ start:209 stop:526 length:318 start_codon:yes stop_codon:yes gene_type:complete
MASGTLNLKHPQFQVVKQAPVGFSWTVFFWGFFPPIFRGDWKFCIIILLCAAITFGFSNLVFAFIYNKLYISGLLDEGYTSEDSENILLMLEGKVGRKIPRTSQE